MAGKKQPVVEKDSSQFAWWKLIGVSAVFLSFFALYVMQTFNKVPEMPRLDPDPWWGPGERPKRVDESVRPFTIDVDSKTLEDLKARLQLNTRFKAPLEGVGFEYGVNTVFLEKVRKYWLEEYDWKKQEAMLNKYPQFKTKVNGMDIHFQRIKPGPSNSKPVVPMLLMHGWPGSFLEFQKAIPLLMDSKDSKFSLELIIPSLPGYGFSDPAAKPGLGDTEMAVVMFNLMRRLGFEKFYVQGGDWGAVIVNIMATLYPDNILGAHVNMAAVASTKNSLWWFLGSVLPASWIASPDQQFMLFPLGEKLKMLIQEMGYMHLQATKPDTVGVALSNDPIGLAAYILEKFSSWTDLGLMNLPDGGLSSKVKFTMDEMLTNVMIYWVNNAITTSMRLYSESFNIKTLGYQMDEIPSDVPYGASVFPHELFSHPDNFIRSKFRNLVSYVVMPRGGHFAAFEEPELLAEHVKSFVGMVEASRLQ